MCAWKVVITEQPELEIGRNFDADDLVVPDAEVARGNFDFALALLNACDERLACAVRILVDLDCSVRGPVRLDSHGYQLLRHEAQLLAHAISNGWPVLDTLVAIYVMERGSQAPVQINGPVDVLRNVDVVLQSHTAERGLHDLIRRDLWAVIRFKQCDRRIVGLRKMGAPVETWDAVKQPVVNLDQWPHVSSVEDLVWACKVRVLEHHRAHVCRSREG